MCYIVFIMKKILIFLLVAFFSSASMADDESLVARAEKAINSFKTAQGMFKQYNADSSIFTGEFWINKPGKMRFEYAYPNKNFIVSNGSFIFYWDEDLQQQTNAPLSYTPAGIILNEEIKFGDEIKVKNVIEEEDYFAVDIYSEENEDMGFISLTFDKSNDRLTQWKISEMNGSSTIIRLSESQFDVDLDEDKFDFEDPRYDPFKLN